MAMDSIKSTAFFLFFFHGSFAGSLPSSSAVKAGYWPAFDSAASPSSAAALYLFTHVYYAFVQVDPATSRIALTANDSLALPLFAAAAHAHVDDPVKAILSVGGAGAVPAANFARIAANASARSEFAASAVAVAREYGLDGLDIDWEYPQSRQEMSDYVALFSELRRAAAAAGRCLLLTAAVHYSATVPGTTAAYPVPYPAAEMAAELDWINVMAYDLHGAWDATATGAHAGLYDAKSDLSASYGLATWLAAGMQAEKLVMGLPLYGRTYNLTDGDEHGIGAPARGVGPGDVGVLTLSEVGEFNRKNRATVVHDEARVATYSFAGETWISYDDSWSATRKVEYARGLGLGGYFLWAIGFDDDSIISRAAWNAWD